MTAPDFAAILGAVSSDGPEMLAAQVPELCAVCAGSVMAAAERERYGFWDSCPDCPTIAHLIAIGAAAWTAIAERDAAYERRENGEVANIHAIDAINAAVKAVQS